MQDHIFNIENVNIIFILCYIRMYWLLFNLLNYIAFVPLFIINGFNLGNKVVQSVFILRGMWILFGLPAYGCCLRCCSMVLYKVRFLIDIIDIIN